MLSFHYALYFRALLTVTCFSSTSKTQREQEICHLFGAITRIEGYRESEGSGLDEFCRLKVTRSAHRGQATKLSDRVSKMMLGDPTQQSLNSISSLLETLGVDHYWDIVGSVVITGVGPTAVQSKIGYLLSGPIPQCTTLVNQASVLHVLTSCKDDEQIIEQFWNLGSMGIQTTTSLENYRVKFTNPAADVLANAVQLINKTKTDMLNAVLAKYQEKFPSAGAEISRSVSEIDTTTAWTNDKTFLPALLAEYDSIIQDQEKVINNYQETLGDQRQRTDQLVRENTRLNRELKDAVQQQVENPHGVDPHAVASGGVASSADLDILYNVQQQLHTAVQEKETAVDLWQTAVGEIDHIRSQLQNEKDSHSWKVIENQAHKVQEQYMQTVSELNAEITNLQSDLRKTRTELTASHLQISDLEKIIDELKHHLQWKEQEHADTAFKEGISDSKMSDFKHRIEDLQQKLIDSEHELSKATGHNSMFEFKVAELQKKCSEFERREFDAVVQVRDSVQVVENAMLEKDEIEIKLKQKEEELIQLQATINQLINEAGARTRKEVDNVRKQCNDNIEKLMDELHVLEMDNGEKQAQLDRLLREKRAVESELEKIYKEGSTQGAKDRGSYEDMNRRAVNAERLKDETDMKVDTLDRNLKMEQMNRNQEKQQMQTEIGNLKERLINVEQEFEVTNDDKLKYLSEIDTLKRKILDAQKDRDAAVRKCNKQMSILSQDKDLQLKEYEAKLQSTEDANRQALTKLRELLGGQQRMSARWKEECSGMTSKFESKITDSRLEVENLRKRNDELASVLRAHQTKTAEAERLISEYNQKIHRLEDRVRETESRASQATKQLSHQSLRQRNGAMDPDLEHAFTAANNFMQRRHVFNRSRLSAVNGRNDHAGSRSPSIHSDHENGINGVDADIDDLLLSDR